jgi:bacteriocin resistance YdeI/OmpD-like protein
MTRFGPEKIQVQLDEEYVHAKDIVVALKKDATTWKHFKAFPASYKRIRVGWIDASRHRPEIFRQRLRYFLKMTAQNKRFGMVQ